MFGTPVTIIRTIIDILLVALFIYYVYRLLRQTRATPVLIGITLLILVFLIARTMRLETVTWLFEAISSYVLIAVIVILQPELRRFFYRLGQTKWYRLFFQIRQVPVEEILQASQQLMEDKTGAILVLVNRIGLKQISEGGIPLQAIITRELILSIFYEENPLHDGAVLIEGNQILSAATYLPLSTSSKLKKTHGARHRAGLGVSEESDALVIVVSEEKKHISVCFLGELAEKVEVSQLKMLLTAFNNDKIKEAWKELQK